jgi:phospholipid/cholesterol/gamma-HCH transport system substrate-binding protein
VKYSNEIKVGVAILVAAAVFYLGVRYFQNIPLFRGSYPLYTEFAEAGGLVTGNPVRINGVSVGRVEAVSLSEDGRSVVVRFMVDEGVTIPEGSQASVSGLAALSGVQLAIELGPPSNPPIEPGGRVPSPPETDILGRLSEQAPVLASKADSVLTGADSALAAITHLLVRNQQELDATLASARDAAQGADRLLSSEETRAILQNLQALTANLQTITRRNDSLNVQATLDRVNTAVVQLEKNLQGLATTQQRLDQLLAGINEGEGTLGRLATDSRLYDDLDTTLVRFNRLLEDFQNDPNRYLKDVTLVEVF